MLSHQIFHYTQQDPDSKYESFSPTLFLLKEIASLNGGEDGLCPEGLLAKSLLQRGCQELVCNWESAAELWGDCVRSHLC